MCPSGRRREGSGAGRGLSSSLSQQVSAPTRSGAALSDRHLLRGHLSRWAPTPPALCPLSGCPCLPTRPRKVPLPIRGPHPSPTRALSAHPAHLGAGQRSESQNRTSRKRPRHHRVQPMSTRPWH